MVRYPRPFKLPDLCREALRELALCLIAALAILALALTGLAL